MMDRDKNILISEGKSKISIIFNALSSIFCGVVPLLMFFNNTSTRINGVILGGILFLTIFSSFFLYNFINDIFHIGELYLVKNSRCFLLKKLFSKKVIPISEITKIKVFPLTIKLVFSNKEQIMFYDFNYFGKGGIDYGLLYRKERKEKFLKKLANFEIYLNDECLK